MKNTYWIFGLLLTTFAGDRLLGYALEHITDKSQFRYSRILNKKTAGIDIMLIGNSRGLMLYQPEIERLTRKNTLNISYNGMPMDLACAITKEQVELNGAPKIAIIDITLCNKDNKDLIASFRTYANKSRNIAELIKSSDEKVYTGGIVSHLYRFNNEIFQRSLYYLNKSDEGWLLDRVISPYMVRNASHSSPYYLKPVNTQVQKLAETVRYLESKGTKVHLVVGPYFPQFKLEGLEGFISMTEKTCRKKVHNFSKVLSDHDQFGDYQHPNVRGSKSFILALYKEGLLT